MKNHFALNLVLSIAAVSGLYGCAGSKPQPAAATESSAHTVQPANTVESQNDANVENSNDTEQTAQQTASASDEEQSVQTETTNAEDSNNIQQNQPVELQNATQATTAAASANKHETVIVTPENTESSAGNEQPDLRSEFQKLMDAGDFAAARKLALDNLKSKKANDREFWAAVEADPLLNETLDATVKPHGTNSLSALGGGSTVSLKYQDSADESAKAAIKPDQDLRQTMYRSEIAYYRLCQILGCSFDTPVTRPVRWTKSDFNTLYNASTSKKNAGYRSKFEHLIWADEGGNKVLYAAYKEWIPTFIGFPIEVTSAWTIYQRPGTTKYPDLNTFYKNVLAGGRPNAMHDLNKLIEYSGDLTTRDILQQLSDLTLIDYLTNNWDRYSGAQDNYGANCHFQPGGIIAIDNGAALPAWHAPRVVKRLNMVQTFSRDLVYNLRVLDPDKLLEHLIPNPTKEELKSYERFKERRAEALKYIDGLINKFGEDKVLIY